MDHPARRQCHGVGRQQERSSAIFKHYPQITEATKRLQVPGDEPWGRGHP
jgi:hypothetical protein